MTQVIKLQREVETLRDRLARLSEASRRINDSLDFESVLQEVLDSARILTNARYGVFTLHNDLGERPTFLTSGLTPDVTRKLWDWQEGMGIYSYLRGIPQPLRLNDFLGHMKTLGLPEYQPSMPINTPFPFLAAPIHNLGDIVGHFFLSDKENGTEYFTSDDEETLVVFASQAALAIANAKRFQNEQMARARLETLIDTSPFGVVVLDAQSGGLVSYNREAARIVKDLQPPDTSFETLLGLVTIRRADGREIPFQEYPVAQALKASETVRAEEIEISGPNGNAVRILVNATPIHLEQNEEPDSLVVTVQDLAALEELDQLKSEFSAMMSHELRVPLSSIKGSAATVLTAPTSFGSTEMLQFFRIIDRQADHMSGLINDLLDVAHIDAGTLSISPEPVPLTELVENARSTFLSGGSNHKLHIKLEPGLPRVMADRRRIAQVLDNLLANAAENSPDASAIRISAVRKGVHVAVAVADEGAGLAAGLLPRLFKKGPPGERGPGLGLAICKGITEAHGGRIWAESNGPGTGALFTFTLPAAVEEGAYSAPSSDAPAVTRPHSRRDRIRILVVDDDPVSLRYVRDILSKAGFDPVVTADPGETLHFVKERKPHLILLDLMLPGSSGIDLMNEILNIANVPVVFLSAYSQEDIVARAFDLGAADYVVKPFSQTELLARIRAALRNQEVFPPSTPYQFKNLAIDYAEHAVTLAGRPVRLNPLEYRLLAHLSASAGRTLTYDHLMQQVWGLEGALDLRPLRTAVKTLRQKLGDDASNPSYIFTEPRVGYRMARSNDT
ncbi:MAG: response regulator [Caldilineaceae bacterium SB0668_bin_21]|nr:response regulator [Caldilineaceae bacterium SB0668_bin_21]MYC24099.1 response regulator [Caldilineaceae bacterium SB0662_bin_25]